METAKEIMYMMRPNCLFASIDFKHAFYFSAPIGLEDVSTYPKLFTTLLASGMWTLEDLKKLAGLNFLRVFREVERVKQNPLFYCIV